MAKKKPPTDDTAPPPTDEAGTEDFGDDAIEPATDDGELEALRARVTELKAENARLKGEAPSAAPAVPGKKWKGSIKHGVPIVVEAPTELHAQQAYKEAAGIISSEHPIEVHPVADDTPLGVVPFHER